MPRLTKAERLRLIKERLANPTPSPAQIEAEKRSAKGEKARRKGDAFQKLIAADLRKIGEQAAFGEYDIRSRAVTGHGEDIIFAPDAWFRFGLIWVECKHYARAFNVERTFRKLLQKVDQNQSSYYKRIPLLVHRVNYQPISATMRQDDWIALSEKPPEGAVRMEELVTVPWEDVLQVLARKLAASQRPDPVAPVLDVEDVPF